MPIYSPFCYIYVIIIIISKTKGGQKLNFYWSGLIWRLLLRIQKARRLFFFRQGPFQMWLHCLCATVHKDSYAVWTPSGSPPNGGLVRFIFSFEGGDYVSLPVSFCQLSCSCSNFTGFHHKNWNYVWCESRRKWVGEGRRKGDREGVGERVREGKGVEWRVQLFSGVARNCRVVGPTRGGGWGGIGLSQLCWHNFRIMGAYFRWLSIENNAGIIGKNFTKMGRAWVCVK